MTQETVGSVFFVLMGLVFVVFRGPLTNYLMAMYPAPIRPTRQVVYWVLVVLGLAFIAFGGSQLLRLL